MVDRLSGTIKMWNEARGFGFIIRDDDERDIFVHASQVVENDSFTPRRAGQLYRGPRPGSAAKSPAGFACCAVTIMMVGKTRVFWAPPQGLPPAPPQPRRVKPRLRII